jgi:hypothetical protein
MKLLSSHVPLSLLFVEKDDEKTRTKASDDRG